MVNPEELSGKTLGQISLMQSVVMQLPDKVKILDFICRGFKDVSGVSTVKYKLENEKNSTAPEGNHGLIKCFTIRHKTHKHAELVFTLSEPELFSSYYPFIENFINMLGVIFEEQWQRNLNREIMTDLEQRVKDRTKSLRIANENMRLEIEERKKITRELKENEFFIQRILDTTPNLIYIYDLVRQKNIFANKEVTSFLGYKEKQIQSMGSKIMEKIIHPEDMPIVQRHHQDMRTVPDDQVCEVFYRLKSADDSWRWLYSRDVPFSKAPDGTVERILGIAADVTDEKDSERIKFELEEQLRKAQKMEAIGTMAGGIAHDFNNILGIVLGNAELAVDDIPEWNPASHNLSEIKKASLRAKGIVQQLLSFTRKTQQEKSTLHIQSIIEETSGLLRATIPSSVKIITDIPSGIGPIEADPTQIHQVIINLCNNASQALENGGTIKIKVSEKCINDQSIDDFSELSNGNYIKLSVSDNGTGIPHDIKDRVFDPYFTTKEVGKGTGLGLSVVHGIVKNHDGAISIHSEPGKRTTVTILFPKAEGPLVIKENNIEDIQTGNETILFVDDESSLALLGKNILTKLGYYVEACIDPQKAFDLFMASPNRFDLVITDMTMPGMTGEQLAKKILTINKDIPIILCTGFNYKITEELAKRVGIRNYLEKPLDIEKLANAVRTTIDEFRG